MNVMVTGGAGFIGSHMVGWLLANTDWHVTVVDNLSYAADLRRITGLEGFAPTRVRFVYHDLAGPMPDDVDRADTIFHFAAGSHVDRSIADPVTFVRNNVDVTLQVFEWARRVESGLVVQVSTDEIYGDIDQGGWPEWSPVRPSNPYSASKAAQEAVAISYWRTYGVPTLITNTVNNFGERQHPEKFVPLVVKRLLEGLPVGVHCHNGKPGSRFWLYAGDHADALLWLAQHHTPQTWPEHDVPSRFNIGSTLELSNVQVVEQAAETLGVEARWEPVEMARPGHDLRYGLDVSKLTGAGWKPSDAGIGRTVEWFANNQEWLGGSQ